MGRTEKPKEEEESWPSICCAWEEDEQEFSDDFVVRLDIPPIGRLLLAMLFTS